jgi:hypothetical protein
MAGQADDVRCWGCSGSRILAPPGQLLTQSGNAVRRGGSRKRDWLHLVVPPKALFTHAWLKNEASGIDAVSESVASLQIVKVVRLELECGTRVTVIRLSSNSEIAKKNAQHFVAN